MKSEKAIKPLSDIVRPLKVTFPVTVEGSVNEVIYNIKRGVPTELSYAVYEAINHSSYAKYIT